MSQKKRITYTFHMSNSVPSKDPEHKLIKKVIDLTYDTDETLQQTTANMISQFLSTGITVSSKGVLTVFPAKYINKIEVEMSSIIVAPAGSIPQQQGLVKP